MDVISISLPDVAVFVATWIVPLISGLLASAFVQRLKNRIPVALPDSVRITVIRSIVAGICVALNAFGQLMLTGSLIDPSTIPEMFYAYAAAAASFDHLFRKR